LGLLFGSAAQATNGYFSDGYGTIAKGMGGAAAATTFDAFGGANNPATMAWVGNRVDGGLDWFQPSRSAQRSGAAIPTLNGSSESGSNNFLIPEFGYNRMLNSTTSLGLTVYGNGGLNTTYTEGNYNCGAPTGNNMLCGSGDLGVDMMQLVLAPTLSMKVGTAQSFGVSVLLGYQRFKADGLQAFNNSPGFPPFTGAPGSVTNNGYDAATGAGLRFGYYGRLSNSFAVGIAYATKMKMGKFDKYKGLFAEAGGFDIPANLNIGVALTPTDSLTVTCARSPIPACRRRRWARPMDRVLAGPTSRCSKWAPPTRSMRNGPSGPAITMVTIRLDRRM
jgi:long-chain fatty acid transport protein